MPEGNQAHVALVAAEERPLEHQVVVAETRMGLEVPGGKKRHAGVMGKVPSCL